jgi:hypothetical protein
MVKTHVTTSGSTTGTRKILPKVSSSLLQVSGRLSGAVLFRSQALCWSAADTSNNAPFPLETHQEQIRAVPHKIKMLPSQAGPDNILSMLARGIIS